MRLVIPTSNVGVPPQPHNLVQLPPFEAAPEQMRDDDDVLWQVKMYLDVLSAQSDVSSYIMRRPFCYEEREETYEQDGGVEIGEQNWGVGS